MRLFLLPISTRRTLLYCQKLQTLPSDKQSWADWGTQRAAKLWAGWEQKESGWQKTVVRYGNKALRQIPYEEWGLKSVPTLSARRRQEEILGKEKHHVVFPESIIPSAQAPQILRTLATEREPLHRSRLIWCFVGMPISAPFALIPVIPNLPFFYLVYRAWSHYRAFAGGKHIQWLVSKNFFTLEPSSTLDTVYPKRLSSATPIEPNSKSSSRPSPAHHNDQTSPVEEKLLLTQESGRQLVKALDIPELEIEIERAIWQVETDIQKQHESRKPSSDSDSASERK
ncbi:mitochondrial K+-H+ exchange-related-domain-containing protein [Xylariaceae sp. FL1272]|nr:mitochondrial K+-H+ exchange-related-domain-containing protein [Xylariaceae sp. FL1272]